MIPDSTNVRVMADNIRKLHQEVEAAVELPTVTGSDEGKILTVNSSGKWAALDPASQLPAVTSEDEGSLLTVNSSGEWAKGNPVVGNIDYSTTEQNTGIKWIDGEDIYSKVFSGTVTASGASTIIDLDFEIGGHLINVSGYIVTSDNIETTVNCSRSSSLLTNVRKDAQNKLSMYVASGTQYDAATYCFEVRYTKNIPVPSNREPDDEPEIKKSTKRKTTKGEN